MKNIVGILLGLTIAVGAVYGGHDLTCYEILEPDTTQEYLEAEVPITPKLGIANLGETSEQDFKVKFIAVNDENEEDTLYGESTKVDIGPYPDSIEVEFPDWIPLGHCSEEGPFRYYELFGVTSLASDQNPENDTSFHEVTTLWSHDAGVIDMDWPEEPDVPPDKYLPGSKITVTATVENFGYNEEYDIEVRLEVHDVDSNDILLWQNTQLLPLVGWRGNTIGDPHIAEVTFPPYTVVNEHRQSIEARTELANDKCPENDYFCYHPPIVSEDKNLPVDFDLWVIDTRANEGPTLSFNVPRQSWVKLSVFDASGRWICSLANDVFSSGIHQKSWDGTDAAGRAVPSGTYLVRMQAEGFAQTRKLLIK